MRIDAIELVSTRGVIVARNTIAGAAPSAHYTVAINGGSENVVESNIVEGGIYAGTSRPDWPRVERNLIRGNTLTAAPGALPPRGLIWFQCNTARCSVSHNVVTGNVLKGAGVNLENDAWSKGGRVDSNDVRGNRITGSTPGVDIGRYVTNTLADRGR
jgi:hypothetical protein